MKKLQKTSYYFFIIIMLISCGQPKTIPTDLENAIIQTVKAYQKEDEKTLNDLILKDFGIAILHQPTFFYQIFLSDKIQPVPDQEYFFGGLELKNYKIFFEELPEFSCGNGSWNKPRGIYCDTVNIDKTLSTTAIDDYCGDGWTAEQIKKFEQIEKKSYKIIVIGKQPDYGYGGDYFIFHLTYIENKWYLTIIEQPDFCSA